MVLGVLGQIRNPEYKGFQADSDWAKRKSVLPGLLLLLRCHMRIWLTSKQKAGLCIQKCAGMPSLTFKNQSLQMGIRARENDLQLGCFSSAGKEAGVQLQGAQFCVFKQPAQIFQYFP